MYGCIKNHTCHEQLCGLDHHSQLEADDAEKPGVNDRAENESGALARHVNAVDALEIVLLGGLNQQSASRCHHECGTAPDQNPQRDRAYEKFSTFLGREQI